MKNFNQISVLLASLIGLFSIMAPANAGNDATTTSHVDYGNGVTMTRKGNDFVVAVKDSCSFSFDSATQRVTFKTKSGEVKVVDLNDGVTKAKLASRSKLQ